MGEYKGLLSLGKCSAGMAQKRAKRKRADIERVGSMKISERVPELKSRLLSACL